MTDDTQYLTLQEYVTASGKHIRTVKDWLAMGELPGARKDDAGHWQIPADARRTPAGRETVSVAPIPRPPSPEEAILIKMTYDEERAEIVAGLKRWALGMYNTQTAVAFIAATNEPLERPWVRKNKHMFTHETMYYFDWARFDKHSGGMSGGEYATWSLVRSLHEGELNEHLWRMDPNRGEAFATAIANCRENWPH